MNTLEQELEMIVREIMYPHLNDGHAHTINQSKIDQATQPILSAIDAKIPPPRTSEWGGEPTSAAQSLTQGGAINGYNQAIDEFKQLIRGKK